MSEEGVEMEDGDSLIVDFSQVEEATFELLPRGNYPVVCVSCEFEYSQSKGSPMWSIEWEVEDGEYAGRKLFTHWVFTEKAAPFVKKEMAAVIPELAGTAFDVKADENVELMLNRRATAKVAYQMYEGEKRNSVKGLAAPSAANDFTG